jgi:hypothetical protein
LELGSEVNKKVQTRTELSKERRQNCTLDIVQKNELLGYLFEDGNGDWVQELHRTLVDESLQEHTVHRSQSVHRQTFTNIP